MHIGRRQQQTTVHVQGEIQLDLGAGMGCTGRPQQFGWQERIRPRRRRPEVVVHPHDPQRIEPKAGAFEHAQHLNGRTANGFRLENTLATELGKAAHGLMQGERAEQAIEAAETVEHFVKGPVGLKFVT